MDNKGDLCERARKMQDKNRKAQVGPLRASSSGTGHQNAQLQYSSQTCSLSYNPSARSLNTASRLPVELH